MRFTLLLITSALGLWYTYRHLRKSLVQIQRKNQVETSPFKRALNYPLTVLWFGYLTVFFLGLTINNL